MLRYRNQRWAERVGLDALTPAEWEDHFARFVPLPGNLTQPLALRYHGHQFRVYNPALGDGRGFLFAQLHDVEDGRLLDLGTKGSGQTPWSRGGDGRLTLKGGVREVLATEMLEALGVSTSKSFSLFETGEELERGDEPSPTRSSVLVRLGHSHVRFGTFQRLRYRDDVAGLRRLVDFAIEHYLPEAAGGGDPVVTFLRAVAARSARLCAAWMAAGFVHGVLNTDNMNVTGESFDYGPYRFLPVLDPDFTAAYFDQTGLYAFGRQPAIVHWNLARLADALAPLVPGGALAPALAGYEGTFPEAFHGALLARLGLRRVGPDEDEGLVLAMLDSSATAASASIASSSTGTAGPRARPGRGRAPRRRSMPGRRSAPSGGGSSSTRRAPGAARPALLAARGALHAPDRRDRGAVGGDRRARRLGAVRGEARRDRGAAIGERSPRLSHIHRRGSSRTTGMRRDVICTYCAKNGFTAVSRGQSTACSSGVAARATTGTTRVPTCTVAPGCASRFTHHPGGRSEPPFDATTTKRSPSAR